jgi:hypothetical protein
MRKGVEKLIKEMQFLVLSSWFYVSGFARHPRVAEALAEAQAFLPSTQAMAVEERRRVAETI